MAPSRQRRRCTGHSGYLQRGAATRQGLHGERPAAYPPSKRAHAQWLEPREKTLPIV